MDAYYELKKYRTHLDAIGADYNPVVFVVDVPDEKTYSKNTSKTIPRTLSSTKSHVSSSDVEYLPVSCLPPSNYHEYTSLYIFEKNFYTAAWSVHPELRI